MAEPERNERRRIYGRRSEDRQRLAMFVAIVLFAALGFWRTEQVVQRQDREQAERSYELCSSSNQSREGIRLYLKALALRDGVIDDREKVELERANQFFGELVCPPRPKSLPPEE
jgi:hypothetical protein